MAMHSNALREFNPYRFFECLHILSGHSDTAGCLTISPNGQTLASGSNDGTIKLWKLHTGELLLTLTDGLSWDHSQYSLTYITRNNSITQEEARLTADRELRTYWKRWVPYLSERQWGTVREDYSSNGTAWEHFPHDHARSRAYRWGEDGIAGISETYQRLCFAIALWNGEDPILKERMFGLTGNEGNHGEDVKEYFFYLDNTPTHSYMKYLYKYPHGAFSYNQLVEENRRRDRHSSEFELLDTGVFAEERYFDVFVEYAKASPEDILIQIKATNRGPETKTLHLLPTLWFRNTWSWGYEQEKPWLNVNQTASDLSVIEAFHPRLGTRWLYCDGAPNLLFTENETNNERLFGVSNASAYVKDGINDYVVQGRKDAINPNRTGTKSSVYYQLVIALGETQTVRLRLRETAPFHLRSTTGIQ